MAPRTHQPRPAIFSPEEHALEIPCRLTSGRLVNILDLPAEALSPEEIARSLAGQGRFLAHTFRPYSNGEHSILVALLAPDELVIEALLHDAPEVYTGDMLAPIKHWLRARDEFTSLQWLNDEVEAQIADAYGLERGYSHNPEIKRADILALKLEQYHFHGRPVDVEVTEMEWHMAREVLGSSNTSPAYVAEMFVRMLDASHRNRVEKRRH